MGNSLMTFNGNILAVNNKEISWQTSTDNPLIAFWPFEDNMVDVINGKNFPEGPVFVPGKVGRAVNTSGQSAISDTDINNTLSSNFSLSCWVNITNSAQPIPFRAIKTPSTVCFSIAFGVDTSAHNVITYKGSNTSIYWNVYHPTLQNKWTHIVLTRNNDGIGKAYFNTEVFDWDGNILIPNTIEKFGVGYSSPCQVDQLRLYGGVINAADVSTLYNNGNGI